MFLIDTLVYQEGTPVEKRMRIEKNSKYVKGIGNIDFIQPRQIKKLVRTNLMDQELFLRLHHTILTIALK